MAMYATSHYPYRSAAFIGKAAAVMAIIRRLRSSANVRDWDLWQEEEMDALARARVSKLYCYW